MDGGQGDEGQPAAPAPAAAPTLTPGQLLMQPGPDLRAKRVRADLEDTAADATEGMRHVVRDGAASRAVDITDSLDGMGDKVAQTKLGASMHKGEWCTDFVNGALEKAGIRGTRNAMAESFRHWGAHVEPKDIKRGDVLTIDFGKKQLQRTGFATGAVKDEFGNVGRPDQIKGRIVSYGVTSGNHDDKVIRTYWEPAEVVRDIRRAETPAAAARRRGRSRPASTSTTRVSTSPSRGSTRCTTS